MLPASIKKRATKPVGAFRDKTSLRRNRFLESQSKYRQGVFEELRQKALEALLAHVDETSDQEDVDAQTHRQQTHRPSNRHPRLGTQRPARSSAQSVSKQLVIPDFLVDVPADLALDWLAYLRPEGPRVVLIASGGRCCVFNKNGCFIEKFSTGLPVTGCTILDGVLVSPPTMSSNRSTLSGNSNSSSALIPTSRDTPHDTSEDRIPPSMHESTTCAIGDEDERLSHHHSPTTNSRDGNCCLANEEPDKEEKEAVESRRSTKKNVRIKSKTGPIQNLDPNHWFSICDCICWNDCTIAESSAECRYFMLKSRFDELKDVVGSISSINGRCLRLVNVVEARADELATMHYYSSHSPQMLPDSIIFVHKEAIYTPEISQLYLCWRDFSLSRFPIDTTDPTGQTIIPVDQQANLLLRLKDAVVLTEDRVVVARLKRETLEEQLKGLPKTIYLSRWMRGSIKDELLIRVSISGLALESLPDDAVISITNEEIHATDLLVGMKIIGTPSPKRVRAETLNRIIHQFILRQTLIRQQSTKQSQQLGFQVLPTLPGPQLLCETTEQGGGEQRRGQPQEEHLPAPFIYNGPLFDFEVILKCAATGASHSRMLLLRGARNLEEFLDEHGADAGCEDSDRLDDWC